MNDRKTNCVNIASVFKTSVGSVNSSFSEDNITIVKKITLPNGRELPYISGQDIISVRNGAKWNGKFHR